MRMCIRDLREVATEDWGKRFVGEAIHKFTDLQFIYLRDIKYSYLLAVLVINDLPAIVRTTCLCNIDSLFRREE